MISTINYFEFIDEKSATKIFLNRASFIPHFFVFLFAEFAPEYNTKIFFT